MAIIENGVVPSSDLAKDGKYDDYELQSACDTLCKAEEIKADPKLMKAVQPLLDKKKKAYTTLAEMRDMASKMKAEETQEGE